MNPYFAIFTVLLTALAAHAAAPFSQTVAPVLREKCSACHNGKLMSGGLNISPFTELESTKTNREAWERILTRIRNGDMPPKAAPKPTPEQVTALIATVEAEFDRADKAAKADPGRVTARRLNRAEYENSVRDLLGVHFRASEAFPPDDSGYGFDNIGDVLTVSPVLMQQYLYAAERIASRAIGGDPLPKAGLFNLKNRIKRTAVYTIDANEIIEHSAEYVVRVLITGHRGPEGKPVKLEITVDGKLLRTAMIESALTQVTKQAGATQRTIEEVRVYLPQGLHAVRAAFVSGDLDVAAGMNAGKNIYPESIELAGPFMAKAETTPRNPLLPCDPAAGAACMEKILAQIARRAYRRPVSRPELAQLLAVAERARKAGYPPLQCVQFALQAVLVSPHFLFRVERDPREGGNGLLSDWELATRLSYFFWSSIPDEELLALAGAGRLHRPDVLDAQARRMMRDAKSAALAENFAGQWLETRSLDAVKPDPVKFPAWGFDLKEAMKTETRMFFEAVMRENLPVSAFIDSRFTFLNETLAKHYGVKGVTGPDFRRVALETDQRGGVLTQASVLTVSSYPSRTSPVLRGKYILENVLGAPPPPPPADVPALDEAAVGKKGTLRQQFEQHRSNAACAACHAKMDVLGFGLENYDAIGRWRTQDGAFPVDASGTFPNGRKFATPAEMKQVLSAELPEFTNCLIEKLLTYALGRGLEAYDRRTVREINRAAAAGDYKFESIVMAIVHSVPFQQRRRDMIPKVTKELASK